MFVKEWFQPLLQLLHHIDQNWTEADEQEKLKLAEQLFALRQTSDAIVESWLQFEEKLSHVIKKVKGAQAAGEEAHPDSSLALIKSALMTPAQDEAAESDHAQAEQVDSTSAEGKFPLLYRKGEGFYHLRLFHDAKKHFADLVKQFPDVESARLYFAYSLLFCGEKEAAMREFRLLSRAASSAKAATISYNAIGCLLAEEALWLEAVQAFKAALEVSPSHYEALYNLALCHLQAEEAREALEAAEAYLASRPDDWEAQIVWLRASSLLLRLDPEALLEPPAGLQLPSRQADWRTLREMANRSEEQGQVHRAYLCYRYLVERLPLEGWVWHGLAWNSWLISGMDRALPALKKAVSLEPSNPDFQFTFGWMHLFAENEEKAWKAFQNVLAANSRHPLARSGLIFLHVRRGELAEAKRLARSFLDDREAFVQSLGYYHLGRIGVMEGNWEQARESFTRVRVEGHMFREVPLFLHICENRLGKTGMEESLLPI